MRWLFALVLIASVLISELTAASPDARDGGARIRALDSRAAALLRDGMLRSPTLRQLVDRIEASNVFVYVGLNPLMKSRMAGQLTWMGKARAHRYVRVSVNHDLVDDQIIATFAHELRHVVEVIEDESVVDEATLVALYRRIGKPSTIGSPAGWETEAARDAGYQARRELRNAAAVLDAVTEQSKS
jgi:hypothetical protein